MATLDELKKELQEGVVEYDTDRVVAAANAVVEAGYPALEAIMNGLAIP